MCGLVREVVHECVGWLEVVHLVIGPAGQYQRRRQLFWSGTATAEGSE